MIKRTRPYRTQRIVEQGKSKLISSIDNRPIWDLLKEYINDQPIGILSRETMISSIYHMKKTYIYLPIVDNYIYQLRAVNVLKAVVNSGKYKKLRDIPINLTTSQLKKISNKNSWESWFMTIDYV